MTTYVYREESGYEERFAAPDDKAAEAHARELLEEGDWGQAVTDESFRVRASVGRVCAEPDGEEDVLDWRYVSVQFDPAEPPCPDRDEHDWDDGQPYGSDHGGVRFTDTCGECGLRRTTDTGATDRSNGSRMTSVSYEKDPDFVADGDDYDDEAEEDE